MPRMPTRVVSGVSACGNMHIGNYFGALQQWVSLQDKRDSYFMVADLHGLAMLGSTHDPAAYRIARLRAAATLLAVGLRPESCNVFFQSAVPYHTELAWYLSLSATKGELERLPGWLPLEEPDPSVATASRFSSSPLLMAADILLYGAEQVPVGSDQVNHVQAAAAWAERFNNSCGSTFAIPRAEVSKIGSRVMDLRRTSIKMSKSTQPDDGVLYLSDSNDELERKIANAILDRGGPIRRSRERPGITNLIQLYAAATSSDPRVVEEILYGLNYTQVKLAVTDSVIAIVEPIRSKVNDLLADPVAVERIFAAGAENAYSEAQLRCKVVRERLGLGRASGTGC